MKAKDLRPGARVMVSLPGRLPAVSYFIGMEDGKMVFGTKTLRVRWWLPSEYAEYCDVLNQAPRSKPSRRTAPQKQLASPEEVSRVMSDLGRKGGLLGGRARANSLSAERQTEIASKAAIARWSKGR